MAKKPDFVVNFSTTKLYFGLTKAWPEANRHLGMQFTKAITDNIWPWPTQPSPRDIVQQPNGGQLRDSYTPDEVSATVFSHAWPTEYAMAVHEGAVIKNGWGKGIQFTLPARPWTRYVLNSYDFANVFATIAKRKMGL